MPFSSMTEWRKADPCSVMCTVALLLFLAVAKLYAAQDPLCSVHVGPHKFTYDIKIKPGTGACDCESWSNGTEFVLATCKGKDSMVLENTITRLVTSECIEKVVYIRSCEKPYKIICVVNCTLGETLESHCLKGSRSHIADCIACGLFLVFLVALIAVYLWKDKCQKLRELPSASV